MSELDDQEIELKLEVPPAELSRLQKLPMFRAAGGAPRRLSEVSVYFDTDKHKLRKHGLILRVCRCGGRYVQTVKATKNADVFTRDEWEAEIEGPAPDLGGIRGTAVSGLLSGKLRRQLKPVFETRVRRTVYP